MVKRFREERSLETEYALGALYELNLGVKKDYKKAIQWYRKTADHGNGLAMTRVACLYGNGNGDPEDPQKIMNWVFDMASKFKPK